ncbi:ExbD/TolR family protein [Flavobacterium terrisoli]|uniref:ExbD/TolR family protein n=1 Tax=Flavobacterium terrisoli TaxID=3242195 RepID=UPI002543F369|nr:biopolymer transporter ExbD [Flavobacterium buctense]
MAELNTGDGGGKKGSKKVRSKKSNAKVDLTAMVDLAFLLITFFMLTTSLSKPQSMDLGLPDKNTENEPETKIKVDQRRTMTIIMGDNDKIKWFHGLLDAPEPNGKPTDAVYGRNGLRKEILKRVVSVPQITGDKDKGLIVIIKPSKKSTYRNLVDVLDEMAICKVPTYAIVNDITPEEMKLVDEMNK